MRIPASVISNSCTSTTAFIAAREAADDGADIEDDEAVEDDAGWEADFFELTPAGKPFQKSASRKFNAAERRKADHGTQFTQVLHSEEEELFHARTA